MKYLLLFLSIIFSSVSYSQTKNYTISELKGMEDQQGHTHLFYRLYYSEGDQGNYSYGNNVYHFDLVNNIDTLFFNDYGSYTITTNYYQGVKDYEFWDNDPSKYIYLGIGCGMDCGGYVQRFDDSVINSWIFFFPGNKIEISNQNDSLLYSSSQFLVKSTDGGRNWFVVDSAYQGYRLVSMSPFDDKVLFVLDNNSSLSKTIDGCKYFTVVDTTKLSLSPTTPMFNYDKDKIHIYRISSFFNGDRGIPAFYVSNNRGEANSWTKKYSSTNNIYVSIDDSTSGTIYLADGNKIFLSTDYGNTFNVYKTLDSTIVGIYKKPASDLLYAATKYDIYEISSYEIKSIKHLITAIDDKETKVPKEFILYQNYPNPFNPSTIIKYQIPKAGLVQLKVYDVLGKEVATLVNEVQSEGNYSVQFRINQNNRLTSGIYFYKLTTSSFSQVRKMVYLK